MSWVEHDKSGCATEKFAALISSIPEHTADRNSVVFCEPITAVDDAIQGHQLLRGEHLYLGPA